MSASSPSDTDSASTPCAVAPARPRRAAALLALCTAACLGLVAPVARADAPGQPASEAAATAGDDLIVQARSALERKDANLLAATRAAVMAAPAAQRHPLAMWVDYWQLLNRLADAQQDELEAFYERWPGSYVEDRLRNDWLLELGRRADWVNFDREFPRFRMNDDREVTCYRRLTEHLAGSEVREAARRAWFAQREADEGCALMAQRLVEDGRLEAADVWRKARLSIDAGRPRAARAAVALLGEQAAAAAGELIDSPARYLARRASAGDRAQAELTTLALMRMAANDPDAAARALSQRWQRALPADLAGWAWAGAARQAALRLQPEAPAYFERAQEAAGKTASDWSHDMHAWWARASLRNGADRWSRVRAAIDAMSPAAQRDPAWIYWKARALKDGADDGADGAGQRAAGHALLMSLSGQMHFYGKLAAEDLGEPIALPPAPAALTAAERTAAARTPGLDRALMLIALGLRDEGAREWNFTLRGMNDRELLAAAELACAREVWDRCINTSDRTRAEVDMTQRYPMPHRAELLRHTQEVGLDPAYVYGLIRQESRFVHDARSSAGAAGLMQIMPATARWTARKLGLPFRRDTITDRDVNLRLGTSYLRLVLDDVDGSQAMAAAAYNAGPSRLRRWREGPALDPVVWAENIPFNETRDYVKKVLSNATYYAALMGSPRQSLKSRLGALIAPRDASLPPAEEDLP